MRFDNPRRSATVLAAIALLAACRASTPGAASTDSATAAPRTDSGSPSNVKADSVVLRTDKSQYPAGDKITLTFENKGARSYTFNPCTRSLEREDNGSWTAVPEAGRMCTMEAWILDPHGTRTGPTELPSPLTAGRYRVAVRMTMDALGSAPAGAVNAVSDPITVS